MQFWKRLVEMDKKFSWSFVGVILALLFGAFTVYTSLIYERKPSIQFDIVSEANVLEVREQLGKLSILFDGENISQKELNLRIITLKIVNNGQLDILQSFFDSTEPWGARIINGKLIEVTTLESNSDYLRSKVSPVIHSPDSVFFNKTIFERDKFITLKILLLHEVGKSPSVIPLGKIAGTDKISVIKSYQEPSGKTIWEEIFGGRILIQLARLIAYTIGLILLVLTVVLGVAMPVSSLTDHRKKNKRQKLVDRFKEVYESSLVPTDSIFLDEFVSHGLDVVETFSGLIRAS